MPGDIEGGADDDLAVFDFGGSTAAGEFVAATAEDFDGFGAEGVAAPGKAGGLGDFDTVQLVFDKREFGFEAGGVARGGEVGVGPTVVADFKAHGVEVGDVGPGHEIRGVRHPAMADKERGSEAEFLEEGADEGAVGFDGIVEGKDYGLGCGSGKKWSGDQGEQLAAEHVGIV